MSEETHASDCKYFKSCGHEYCPAVDFENCDEYEPVVEGKYYGDEPAPPS